MQLQEINRHLTGNVRFRMKKRLILPPLIVLQVEETVEIVEPNNSGMSMVFERWRDATPFDPCLETCS